MRGLFILLFLSPLLTLAQNGIVRGKTVNLTNNQALDGVKILIVELSTVGILVPMVFNNTEYII